MCKFDHLFPCHLSKKKWKNTCPLDRRTTSTSCVKKNTATSTFDFGDICWNLSEIHWIVWEIDEKAQTSFVSKMRMRIDHGHM